MSMILTAALAYAQYGFCVFPAPPDCKKSFKCAEHSNGCAWGMTRDAAEITADFTRWPDARIGIPTGAINGIVVVETDTVEGHGVDGAAALAELEACHGVLPETLQAISPSGSIHRYFGHPGDGIKIRNSVSVLGVGIDVRGDGGMVIAPPSPGYAWLNSSPIAPLPTWLIELTRQKPPTISQRAVAAISRPIEASNAYAAAAVQYELANIHRAEPGHRNAALNQAGFSLGQLVAIDLLNEAEVARLLFEAAAGWGNPNKDRDVIRYAMQAGKRHPRSRR